MCHSVSPIRRKWSRCQAQKKLPRMTPPLLAPTFPFASAVAGRTPFRFFLLLVAGVFVPALAPSPTAAATTQEILPSPSPQGPVVVYLVRHAEKADDGTNDPPLAVAGQIRVRILQALLADVVLTHVHTTDWKRTRGTAQPIAEAAGLDPQLYDAGDLAAVAAAIRASPGRHLVVGHSNTTPELTAALGGDPSGPIHEMEYDRLYVVTIQPGHNPLTTLLRFGEPYVEGEDFGLRAGREPSPVQGARTSSRDGN